MLSEIDEIVGFDLGDGETSLNRIPLQEGEAGPVEIKKSKRVIPTLVAVCSDGTVLIGEDAVGVTERRVDERYTSFKSADVHDPAVRRPIELFVGEALARLRARDELTSEQTMIAFGHPSGWTRVERDAYGAVLAKQALPCQATLLPESRAAFMTAHHYGYVPRTALSKTVIVIDCGSSTTDFTSINGGVSTPLESGSFDGVPLGAGQLDEQLLMAALARCPEADELGEWLAADPARYAEWLFEFRRLKEHFYASEETFRERDRAVTLTLDWGPQYSRATVFRLRPADFDGAVVCPLPELAGQSWRERFNHDVQRAKSSLRDEPQVVILTGGASRMGFVVDDTRTIFCGRTSIRRPDEPEHAISRGLALAGRLAVRTAAFWTEVENLIASGSVRGLLVERLPEFATSVGGVLAGGATNRFIIPELMRWRESDTGTLRELSEKVAARMAAWQRSEEGQRASAAAATQWYDNVVGDLQELTREICQRYQMPADALKLPVPELQSSAVGGFSDFDTTLFGGVRAVGTAVVSAATTIVTLVLFAGTTGPFAPAITAAVMWLLGDTMVETMSERLMDRELSPNTRKWMPAEWLRKRVLKQADKTEAQIRTRIEQALTDPHTEAEQEAREYVLSSLSDAVEQELRKRIQQVEVLIADLPVTAGVIPNLPEGAGAVAAASEAELDINTASAEELQAVLGLSAEQARRTTERRKGTGGFATVNAFADALDLPPHLRARAMRRAVARRTHTSKTLRRAGAVEVG